MKILIVLTSHDQAIPERKLVSGWKSLLLYYVLKDAGAALTLASPKGGQPLDPKSEVPRPN